MGFGYWEEEVGGFHYSAKDLQTGVSYQAKVAGFRHTKAPYVQGRYHQNLRNVGDVLRR